MFNTSDFRDNLTSFHMHKSSGNSAIHVSITDGHEGEYRRMVEDVVYFEEPTELSPALIMPLPYIS